MAVIVEVTKNKNETNVNLLRRFSRKARNIGFMREVRGRRFFQRDASQLRRKQGALARIAGRERYTELKKLGKLG